MIKKLSIRKLWAAVAGLVAGLAMAFGLDESVISQVSGAVVSVASVIAYIVTEGKIDAAAIGQAAENAANAVDSVISSTSTFRYADGTVSKMETTYGRDDNNDSTAGN